MERKISLAQGELTYQLQFKKIKYINLTIKGNQNIMISAPLHTPIEKIEEFIQLKSSWIESKLDQLSQQQLAIPPTKTYVDGDIIYYLGQPLTLRLVSGKNQVQIMDNIISVSVTDPMNYSLKEYTLDCFFAQESKRLFKQWTEEIYPQFQHLGISLPQLKIKKMTSRWGSCHRSKEIITLNQQLIHTPISCIKYVIYHEYVHFIHGNHSKEYYQELAKYVPDYQHQRELLKQYSTV